MNYNFSKSNCNGQSQCQKCSMIGWDCLMYKVKEFDNKRVCEDCKKYLWNIIRKI